MTTTGLIDGWSGQHRMVALLVPLITPVALEALRHAEGSLGLPPA
jgi:hypothetical protein